ncbi:g1011 [Coccomyxa viridis]|uniref:G1011 protein n=1 Tax=Coccomyxa viridis TaxID=1274662 RepID=A0ABP1FH11_9CHLO
MRAWLHQHDLGEYREAFSLAGVGRDMLALLGNEELRQMGVLTLGPRRRILAAIQATQASVQSSGVAEGGGKITSFFVRKGAGTAACPAPAKPAQHTRAHEWQRVRGTIFLVDCFGKSTQLLKWKFWFPMHFHSDDCKGLQAYFKQGHIYCTQITAKLAHNRLKVPWERFEIVQLRAPLLVQGVTITFLDANHCPVLHTADFRYHVGMQQEQALQRVRGKASIGLDTTYCSPQHLLPPQLQVVQFLLEAVRTEAFNPATLFLCGSYTIGKERLFLEVARILKRKVYVSVAKRKIVEALNLPAEYKALLTTYDRAALLHAVPLPRPASERQGMLLPVEGERWQLILTGLAGDHPPTDEEGYLEFARSLPSPEIYDALTQAEALGPVHVFNRTENVKRSYGQVDLPQGLCVLGDAATCFNPIYGQGMTVGIKGAILLRDTLQKRLHGRKSTPAEASSVLSGFSKEFPWTVATGDDEKHLRALGKLPPKETSRAEAFVNWYFMQAVRLAMRDVQVRTGLAVVNHMLESPAALFQPLIAFKVFSLALRDALVQLREKLQGRQVQRA